MCIDCLFVWLGSGILSIFSADDFLSFPSYRAVSEKLFLLFLAIDTTEEAFYLNLA